MCVLCVRVRAGTSGSSGRVHERAQVIRMRVCCVHCVLVHCVSVCLRVSGSRRVTRTSHRSSGRVRATRIRSKRSARSLLEPVRNVRYHIEHRLHVIHYTHAHAHAQHITHDTYIYIRHIFMHTLTWCFRHSPAKLSR